MNQQETITKISKPGDDLFFAFAAQITMPFMPPSHWLAWAQEVPSANLGAPTTIPGIV